MWKILLWLLGSCRVRITGGSPAWAVSRLSEARILLRDVTPIDDFTIEARILTRDAARADAACTRAMCTMEILETSGAPARFPACAADGASHCC
ncbi:MAG: sporulation protein YqfD [Oscillospiraceae bacterium]